MPENKENKRLQYLFQRYLTNQISEEEYLELWKLLQTEAGKNVLSDELQSLWESALHENAVISKKQWGEKMQQLISQIEMPDHKITKVHKISRPKFYRWTAAVVVAILVIAGVIYLYPRRTSPSEPVVVHHSRQQDKGLSPGGNKAVLTLSNGSRIILDSAANGILTQQGKTRIIKSGSGKIAYNPSNTSRADVVYNTLSTPRGGKYQITLPDGTKVWLNAASTLRFPTSFPGEERVVEMTGEAYFEVAPHPHSTPAGGRGEVVAFIVKVDGMKVSVLGTHFNIMAYDNEPVVKTTLLEGAVRVKKGGETVLLKPGQQARMNKQGDIQVVKNANVDKAIAWKNNLFWFDENNIHEVMRQVSRWYDADVVIEGNIPQHFTGSIPRNVNVLRVFQVLQETGNVHLKIEGHKIIITP